MNAEQVLAALWSIALYHLPVVINVAVAGIVCVVLGCRVAKMMRGVTELSVFVQHAVLAIGMFGSILLSFAQHSEWAAASASAGVLVFLLMSLKRWRFAPPAGTNRPRPLQPGGLRHAVGGVRSKP